MQRQYSGTAGRIENCQIGVFLAYASRHGRALIDRALYLPEGWAEDRARRAEAGMPEEVAFATKPKLGLAMLERALAAGVPFAWVTGDSVYGADHALRRWLQEHGLGYVLAVTKAQRLGFGRVEDWVDRGAGQRLAPPERRRRRQGAAALRLGLPALRRDAAPGWEKGLLIRRSIAEPDELAFYLTHAPDGTALADLVRVAGTRWAIEACFEAAKGEVGLDQYEVRSWTGWHRHVTLAMLAHAYLAVLRKAAVGGEPTLDLAAELLPLTVPEVRRLLWRLVWPPPPDIAAALAWSRWRRRHQQRARRCHWQRRTSSETRL